MANDSRIQQLQARIRDLEDENAALRRLVAKLSGKSIPPGSVRHVGGRWTQF